MMEQDQRIDGRTKRALDVAIARKLVSQESYRAVMLGELSLTDAKAIGQDGAPATDAAQGQSGPGRTQEKPGSASAGRTDAPQDTPPQPVSRISKDDSRQSCWCGCGSRTSPNRRFRPGHDQRSKGIIKRAVREGKAGELSPQLREYGLERGLLDV